MDVGAKSTIGLVGLRLLSLRDGAAAFAFAAALDPCRGLPSVHHEYLSSWQHFRGLSYHCGRCVHLKGRSGESRDCSILHLIFRSGRYKLSPTGMMKSSSNLSETQKWNRKCCTSNQ